MAIQILQPAPQFKAKAVFNGGEVKEISLSDYKGQWVVLFFYPLDFSLVCPTELVQFRSMISEFEKCKAQVIGCSVDSEYSHKRWLRDDLGNLNYPLISDLTKRISKDYGVLLEERGISTRATFIIDPDQKIQFVGIQTPAVGRNAEEILRVLQACQSGEACQAGWKKGDIHIVAPK